MIKFSLGGQSAVMNGDSITYGYNSSSLSLRWTSLLTSESGGSEVNLGAPGQHLQVVSGDNCFSPTYTPSKSANNSKYMFFSFGVNDAKDANPAYNVVDFKSTLESVLDYFVTNDGWNYTDIITPTINYLPLYETQSGLAARIQAYNAAILEVAREKNTIYIDLFSHFYNLPNRNSYFDPADDIHPLDNGHREIANFYEASDFTPINDLNANQVIQIGRNVIFS